MESMMPTTDTTAATTAKPRRRLAVCQVADAYLAIKTGLIKVDKTSPLTLRFWNQVDKVGLLHPEHGQCWAWLGGLHEGYGRLRQNKKRVMAHRVSWLIHFGEVPDDLCVLHRCDNRACTNPEHLFLGTNQDNTRDRNQKHRQAKGSRVAGAILTETQVREIRRLYRPGHHLFGRGPLADRYGVSYETLGHVVQGRYWRHVTS